MTGRLPAGLSPESAEAARSTLGGAVAAAAELPQAVASALVSTAREAFLRGFERAAIICAAVAAVLAVLVLVLLRGAHTRPAGGSSAATTKELAWEVAPRDPPVID
jgi:DHA2 family multidrug resistance protein-like MFS transporter